MFQSALWITGILGGVLFLPIFLFSFFVFCLISFLKIKAITHLFHRCVLLLLSIVLCSCFYLFIKHGFYIYLYNDFTAYTRLGYLVFLFMLLSDIALKKDPGKQRHIKYVFLNYLRNSCPVKKLKFRVSSVEKVFHRDDRWQVYH